MLKREKKPKPWETEDSAPEITAEELYSATQDEAMDGSLSSSPLSGSEDPDEEALIPEELLNGELAKHRKKKRNPKAIVFLLLVLLVAGILVFRFVWSALKGPDPTYAEFQTVQRGDIHQSLSSSGVIRTADKRTIFSPATAPISVADLKLGSVVNAGSQIFAFDTTELERSARTAAAGQSLSSLQAQQARQNSAEAQQNANDYQSSMATMQQQRDIAKARAAQAQANLDSVNTNVAPLLAAKQAELKGLQENQTGLYLSGDTAGGAALQPQIDALATEISGMEAQLQGAATALSAAQADVEYHNGMVAQLENLRDQNEKGVLDQNGQAQLNAQGVTSQMSLATVQDQLAAAQAGITAPITGVVTALQAEEGALASQYSPLCVIESLEKVDVLLSLSRYDLERVKVGQKATITILGNQYSGTVTHIDSMATTQTTQSGVTNYVSATVSILNPDQNITLGIDANVSISTGEASGVLMVPASAVNTDVDGSYVYLNVDNTAVRRSVETGLSSDTDVEITSGLSEGETVILSSQNLQDGMQVSDDPAYRSNLGMGAMMMG